MSEKQSETVAGLKLSAFRNERLFPCCGNPEVKQAFPRAIAIVRKDLGGSYPLYIDGKEVVTDEVVDSINPANPDEVIGRVCQAGAREVEDALIAAQKAFLSWRDTSPGERSEYLVKAAAIARERIYEFSAWQVLEEGKQWAQAYNDMTEGIDFLEYYAREMIRLGQTQDMGSYAGETNQYFYQPRGIAAVIAPWNFPFAISCGMCAAAIVTGNCVVFKPSNQSPVVGHHMVEMFSKVGLPPGVFNYTPGRSSVIGDFLVDSPKVSIIAFTGSMEVGLRIIERAGRTPQNQHFIKKVVCEMGGKNAIIIDEDADFDKAITDVLYSAFGYQGQKCSACSRLIVLDKIYDEFVSRLVEAARKLKIGPAEDPENYMGAVIDKDAQKKILEYVKLGAKEGTILYSSEVPQKGYYVPLTIVGGITPKNRLAHRRPAERRPRVREGPHQR
jgi:RHH-type proline utilization regulon transcriptional repressor/proline dehydrogenase/delta 1-pyrroline-5-carboxylate dehydrogenase